MKAFASNRVSQILLGTSALTNSVWRVVVHFDTDFTLLECKHRCDQVSKKQIISIRMAGDCVGLPRTWLQRVLGGLCIANTDSGIERLIGCTADTVDLCIYQDVASTTMPSDDWGPIQYVRVESVGLRYIPIVNEQEENRIVAALVDAGDAPARHRVQVLNRSSRESVEAGLDLEKW